MRRTLHLLLVTQHVAYKHSVWGRLGARVVFTVCSLGLHLSFTPPHGRVCDKEGVTNGLNHAIPHNEQKYMGIWSMKQSPISTRRKPALNGAAFFATHWGAVAVFAPFINIYFAEVGLTGVQIGLLSALWPLATLAIAPFLSAVADRFQWRVPILQVSSLLMALCFLPLVFLDNNGFYFFIYQRQ